MQTKQITEKSGGQKVKSAKKVYGSPVLKSYGSVSALTMGGSGSFVDGANSTKMSASDRSLKENLVKIGTHPVGIGLYLYHFKPDFRDECGHGRQFGVMADEVEAVMPEAVSIHAKGYKQVDYRMLGIVRAIH